MEKMTAINKWIANWDKKSNYMYQLSNKQPQSIIYFILNSKNFEIVLISSNIFIVLLGFTWESPRPLCALILFDVNVSNSM